MRDLGHFDPGAAFSPQCVRFFLHESICGALDRRKISMRLLILVMQQHKRKHKTIDIERTALAGTNGDVDVMDIEKWGYRSDNSWLWYDVKKVPKSEKEWNDMYVLKQSSMGFTTWPRTLKIYAPFDDQPNPNRKRDELNPVEQEIYDFFIDKNNMDKLIKYLTIEDKKGQDKFSRHRYLFFKSLFRDFGTTFLDQILDHLEKLVVSNEESYQRAGAEILAGVLRGAKHWSYNMIESLKVRLLPIIRNALDSTLVETVTDWGKFCKLCTYI